MKKLFALFALLACMATTYAQNSLDLVATLNHNDTIKVYYSANALKDAHAAAVDGDVITLSSGTFLATDITKGITLRGAGAWVDTVAKRQPTVIMGDFDLGTANTTIKNLCIEGIYHNSSIAFNNLTNSCFLKCRINSLCSKDNGKTIHNTDFINCKIASIATLGNSIASFYNCVINELNRNAQDKGSFSINNCIIFHHEGNYGNSRPLNTTFCNSIIYQVGGANIHTSCLAYNCVNPNKVGTGYSLFQDMPAGNNRYTTSEVLFKTYRGGKVDYYETFELTDSAKTTFLGTDGTQVGIYGGTFPFDPTVSVPQITKFEVAKQSTADGKLNVDIEVNAAAVEPKK